MTNIKIFNTNLKVTKSLFSSFYTNPVHNQYDKHNLMSETFVSKKLSRFVFPQQDLIDPKWVVDHLTPLESLLHLMNISWDRLSEGDCLGRDVSKTGQRQKDFE